MAVNAPKGFSSWMSRPVALMSVQVGIYNIIMGLAKQGVGIILVSSEMEEISIFGSDHRHLRWSDQRDFELRCEATRNA
jgi:hypothetical protein